MKRLLQLLQWQRPAERWVLKSPHHLEWLDTLLAVFPDAKIIQTHRDPVRTIASTCSMIAHSWGIFSDHVDPHEVGQHWGRKIYRLVERSMDTRRRAPASQFLDVSYYDLVTDPTTELERIYRFIDRPLDRSLRSRLDASRRRHRQHQYGRHVYRLDSFGLSADDIEPNVARYRDRYGIRHE